MVSCDTMVLPAAFTAYLQNVLVKNSDRPTGEPQPLCFYPGGTHGAGETVKTTYLTIPQVARTYAVVGSRPYWIYGFEMGYNECGLVIGNEAEGSRLPADEADGLLGMDMLRLALERAATAREAIEVITGLLTTYGQKANACLLFHRTYENTFVLADKEECWVLETAGRQWVAKQIKGPQGISNCYSIDTDFDLCSENLESIARERRFLSPDERFDFAKAYSGRLPSQPLGAQRFRRLNKCLSLQDTHDFSSLARILRDHHEGELIEPRFGETAGTFMSICMHMRDFGESETSASLLWRYDGTLGQIARYAPAQPCLSAYIPVYMTALPKCMETAEKIYDEGSLWWRVKRLSLLVAVDELLFAAPVRADLAALEERFEKKAAVTEDAARTLIASGEREAAMGLLSALTEECTAELYAYAKEKSAEIASAISAKGGLYGRNKEPIEAYAAYAEIPMP